MHGEAIAGNDARNTRHFGGCKNAILFNRLNATIAKLEIDEPLMMEYAPGLSVSSSCPLRSPREASFVDVVQDMR